MRTLRHRWIDLLGLLFTLAAAGALMFALLPQRTQPGQQVVPPLPANASDPTQALLTILVVMTVVGAPVMIAIVFALVMRRVSKQLPANSAAAESAAKSTKPVTKPETERSAAALSPREERFWKVVATTLTLGISTGVVVALWPDLVRLFSR